MNNISNTRLEWVKLLLVKGDKGDKGDAGDGRELEQRLEAEITERERADTTLLNKINEVDGKLDLYEGVDKLIVALQDGTQPTLYWMLSDETLFKLRYFPENGQYILEYYDGTNWVRHNPFSDLVDVMIPQYSTSAHYYEGDWVIYNGQIYCCTTETASSGESWTSSHWTSIANWGASDGKANWTLADEIAVHWRQANEIEENLLSLLHEGEEITSHIRINEEIQGITENSVRVSRIGGVVQVDAIVTITEPHENLAQLAWDLPEPITTVRFEAIPRSANYSRPLSITLQKPYSTWTLCAQYGDVNATTSNPVRYYVHFTYIAKTIPRTY